jgi:Protein of unknown function (DUF1326)
MVQVQEGWKVEGVFNDACASEGVCPYYLGRDVQNGCRYFWVFRIRNGKINGIDLANTTIIYIGDTAAHSSFQDLIQQGSEGEIYISDSATREQREVLNALAVQSLGGMLMRNVSRTEYVKMDILEEGQSIHIKMPYGEMKQSLTTGGDGKTPVRVENHMLPMLTDVKTCHTHFWRYQGNGRQIDYCDRCGVWADFTFEG